MAKTYKLNFECENCLVVYTKDIPFGFPASDYDPCPSCGCKSGYPIGTPINIEKVNEE